MHDKLWQVSPSYVDVAMSTESRLALNAMQMVGHDNAIKLVNQVAGGDSWLPSLTPKRSSNLARSVSVLMKPPVPVVFPAFKSKVELMKPVASSLLELDASSVLEASNPSPLLLSETSSCAQLNPFNSEYNGGLNPCHFEDNCGLMSSLRVSGSLSSSSKCSGLRVHLVKTEFDASNKVAGELPR